MIDIENQVSLVKYLKDFGHLADKDDCEVQLLTGGVSNKTVLVKFNSGKQWVMKQALTKLRVEVDWSCDPNRLIVEAKALEWLRENLSKDCTPGLIFVDKERFILAMEAVLPPFENLKDVLLGEQVEFSHIEIMAKTLARIHIQGKSNHARSLFADRSFFEVLRLEPYYLFSGEQEPSISQFMNELVKETRGVLQTVVHGDYSPKNMLVKGGEIILLDHEVMHIGDPAFDIGFAMCHLLSKANWLKNSRQKLLAAAKTFWQSYRDEETDVDKEFEARACRHVLACLIARVKGRSKLEYLDERSASRQWNAASQLTINSNIRSIPELIDNYDTLLTKYDD